MTDLTASKYFRLLLLIFLAVIAMSLVLIVIELQSPKVIQTLCEHKKQADGETDLSVVYLYYSDGSFSGSVNPNYSCATDFEKYSDGKNYPSATLP